MKKLLLVLGLLVTLLSVALFANEKKKELHTTIAFVGKNITQANFSNAKSAMQIWMNQLTKAKDLNVKVDIVYFDSFDEFKKAFKKGEVESVITSPYIYLTHQSFFNKYFQQGWVKTLENQSIFFDYDFIVRNDVDLKTKRELLVGKNKYNKVSEVILDYYAHILKKKFFYKDALNDNKVIINTFFKKTDACLVQNDSWQMAVELNPQLAQEMHIVKKTKRVFVNMISLIANSMKPELKELYFDQMQIINQTEEGKQLKNIFGFNGTRKIDVKDFKPMIDYYQELQEKESR